MLRPGKYGPASSHCARLESERNRNAPFIVPTSSSVSPELMLIWCGVGIAVSGELLIQVELRTAMDYTASTGAFKSQHGELRETLRRRKRRITFRRRRNRSCFNQLRAARAAARSVPFYAGHTIWFHARASRLVE